MNAITENSLIPVQQLDKWDTWPMDLEQAELEITDKVKTSVDAFYTIIERGFTCKILFSNGKDSNCILSLFLLAMMRAKRNNIPMSQHHFLININTGIENPEVHMMTQSSLSKLNSFINTNSIPLKTYVAEPSLSSSWPSRVIGGRGIPTFVTSKYRQCTHELKISGANRKAAEHIKTMPKSEREKVVLVLGSRDSESVIRSKNIEKFGGHEHIVVETEKNKTLYPIKSWLSTDVWEFLTYSGQKKMSIIPSFREDNYKLVDLYRDSGGSECVIFQPDDQDAAPSQSACGSRHGCSFCLAAGSDKSMTSLLKSNPERYSYMEGLNRVQRFLDLTRNDWSLRHPVGRTIYEGGYIKIQPDVYSPKMLRKLLHAIISYDYLEQKRASELAAKINSGELEANEHNLEFSKPQFQIIDERQLLAIEFLWSLHHFQKLPFEAIDIWHSVYTRNELELLNEVEIMEATPKTPQPKPLWLKVGSWSDGSEMDGISDFWTEFTYFESDSGITHRTISTDSGERRVVDFNEASLFDIDLETAKTIVWDEYENLSNDKRTGFHKPYFSASYLLRFGAVEIGKGQAARYHVMAQRGQAYHRLGLTGDVTMESIAADEGLKHLIVNNSEYKVIAKKEAEIKAQKLSIETAIQEKKSQIVAKRKAWIKANKAKAKIHKQYKSELEMQRKYVNQFQTLFIIAANIHAQYKNMSRANEEVKSIIKVLMNLKTEIQQLRTKMTVKSIRKANEFQLYMNKEFLDILKSGDFSNFESDHLKRYAQQAPIELEKELAIAIKGLTQLLSGKITLKSLIRLPVIQTKDSSSWMKSSINGAITSVQNKIRASKGNREEQLELFA